MNHINICGQKLSRWDKGYRDFDSLDEMNNTLLDNCNKMVGQDDTLIFGGDFLFGPNKEVNFWKFWDRIVCRNIIFIRGNHDTYMNKPQNRPIFDKINPVDSYELEWDGVKFDINHYSPEERKIVRRPDIIYLFGHHHGTYIEKGFELDIGIDTFSEAHKKYTPYSITEIIEIMKLRGYK